MVPLYRGDLTLKNIYTASVVDPHTVPGTNGKLATEFFEFLVSPAGQDTIRQFGERTFKRSVLVPVAHLDPGLRQRQTQRALTDKARQLSMQQGYTWALGIALLLLLITFVVAMRLEVKRRKALEKAQKIAQAHNETMDQNIILQKQIFERKKAEEKLSQALNVIRSSEAELAQEKERAEVTLHSIGDAVITTDQQGNVEYFNPVAERLTGTNLSELEGRLITEVIELLNEGDQNVMENPVVQCLRERSIVDHKHYNVLRRSDGEIVPITCSAAPIINKQNEAIGAVLVIQDVTPTRKLTQELAYQAEHDALTGLLNRTVFETRLQNALDSAVNTKEQHVLCYLDLDQFKLVNDTCGHRAGDEFLRQVALLLKKKVRDSDVLARLGGDELGILFMDCQLTKGIELAQDLLNIISDYSFAWESHTFNITASIGVVGITAKSSNIAQLMSDADVACFQAKDMGGNRVRVYDRRDRTLEERRGEMQWIPRLTKAFSKDHFELYVQPVLPIKNAHNNLRFYEILIRLIENDRVIEPSAFLPAAERYNMMASIDAWVIENLFGFFSSHRDQFKDHFFMVNVSGQSLGEESFLRMFEQKLDSSGISAQQLCVEITETAAITNLSQAVRFMDRLKTHGCKFALDDFGSGLSSFAYLKTLAIDLLKIDGSFVRDMERDIVDRSMIEAIIKIGRVVGTMTVAECVEDRRTLDTLEKLGVDFVQGFFIGRPQPIQTLLKEPGLIALC